MKKFFKQFRFYLFKRSGISLVISFGMIFILFVVGMVGYKALNKAMDATTSMQNRKNEMPDESGDLELNFAFKNAVQLFSLEISQARRNANLNKKCNRRNPSITWQFFMEGFENNHHTLKCFYNDEDFLGEVQFLEQELPSEEVMIEGIFVKNGVLLDPDDDLLITFYSESPKTKIEYFDGKLHEVDNVRIVFKQTRGLAKKMAICLTNGESIQTINLDGDTCE